MDALKSSGKPFEISKREVWEAYRQVKANRGAPGVDEVTLGEFETDLGNNLYRIWNRMSSGSYFPPPVKAVEIAKPHGGGTRMLGVPTVADRIAETVVARRLEAKVEPIFHPDSYGYRPNRSALDAVAACRQRCWKSDWIVDLDIRSFFDSVPWQLVVKAVAAHSADPWVLLYVRRWLAAPLQLPDGSLLQRDRGTPQGSAVSPVLANLFLHYAFDAWVARSFPSVKFERYADDAIAHCASKAKAEHLLASIGNRLAEVGLQLNPAKTRIVYCEDGRRRLNHEHTSFTFLGFTFRARGARSRERCQFHRLPARRQQARPQQDEQGSAPLAAPPAHRPHPRRPRTQDQPSRARLAPVLRCLLPDSTGSTPTAHQCLPGALAPTEVSRAQAKEEGAGLLAAHHSPAAAPVRPLGVDGRLLVIKTTRAG